MERRRWLSERDDLTKQHRRAFGTLDRAQAAIVEAQLGKANAQLSLIEAQLARTRIVAPFDGVIVSGDLSRSLGVPVERGQILFELAPLDTYRIALQVNEGDITHIDAGQHGDLALAALPDERLPFLVEDIVGIATTDEGRNGFRVEAGLEGSAKFRPGMRGVGKIVVGERSLLWIWTHSLADRVSPVALVALALHEQSGIESSLVSGMPPQSEIARSRSNPSPSLSRQALVRRSGPGLAAELSLRSQSLSADPSAGRRTYRRKRSGMTCRNHAKRYAPTQEEIVKLLASLHAAT